MLFSQNPISGKVQAYTDEGQFIGFIETTGDFLQPPKENPEQQDLQLQQEQEEDQNFGLTEEQLNEPYPSQNGLITADGGPGSGNWGHQSVAGKRGGSAPKGQGGGSSASGSSGSSSSTVSVMKTGTSKEKAIYLNSKDDGTFMSNAQNGSCAKLDSQENTAIKSMLDRFRGKEWTLLKVTTPAERAYYLDLKAKALGEQGSGRSYMPDTVAYALGQPKVMPTSLGDPTKNLPNGSGITPVDLQYANGKKNSLLPHTSKGKLTRQREQLHRNMTDKCFEGISKPKDGKQTFYMMGGGSASGKSSIINNPGAYGLPAIGEYAKVDSDELKVQFPEYQQKIQFGQDDLAAKYCHMESSFLSTRICNAGLDNGYNVMLDGTGDGSIPLVKMRINWARKRGMPVQACYVTCDLDQAIRRSNARAQGTGRVVPQSVIQRTHKTVSQIFQSVAPEFDHVTLYDTNGPKPVLIAQCYRGGKIDVKDKAAYKRFLSKGR